MNGWAGLKRLCIAGPVSAAFSTTAVVQMDLSGYWRQLAQQDSRDNPRSGEVVGLPLTESSAIGTQPRRLFFDQRSPQDKRTWQGHSTAEWNLERPANFRRRVFEDPAERSNTDAGSLRVQTSYLRPAYLRKNGVPFSAQAEMTEYFNVLIGRRGERYLAVQTYVEDPVFLNAQFVRTLLFKRESDGSKWNPTACVADGWASN